MFFIISAITINSLFKYSYWLSQKVIIEQSHAALNCCLSRLVIVAILVLCNLNLPFAFSVNVLVWCACVGRDRACQRRPEPAALKYRPRKLRFSRPCYPKCWHRCTREAKDLQRWNLGRSGWIRSSLLSLSWAGSSRRYCLQRKAIWEFDY